MTRVLVFKVEVEGLEGKIWRKIEISDSKTVADLAYTILASFDSLAYHLYDIFYKDKKYICITNDDYCGKQELIDATITKLNNLDLNDNDKLVMEYDFGATNAFKIKCLGSRELEKGRGTHYPYIIDGARRGIIDDISDYELKEIVDSIDKKGESDFYFTPGYDRKIKYDYRDYDIKSANILLKGMIEEIKYNYEEYKK